MSDEFIIGIALACTLFVGFGIGRYTAPKTECPPCADAIVYSTLKDATDAATPGDIIALQPGESLSAAETRKRLGRDPNDSSDLTPNDVMKLLRGKEFLPCGLLDTLKEGDIVHITGHDNGYSINSWNDKQ